MLPLFLLTTSNLCMCNLFKRCGFLGAGTLAFYVGGDLGCRATKGVRVSEEGEGSMLQVKVWDRDQCLEPKT